MATPKELHPGAVFYTVAYHDDDLLIPWIETLEFVERVADDDGADLWVFRTPGAEEGSEGSPPYRTGYREDDLYRILDMEGLCRVISELAQVHAARMKPLDRTPCVFVPDERAFDSRIREWMAGSVPSLHVRKRYSDDGCFLKRAKSGSGFSLRLFPHPLRNPRENQRIDAWLQRWKLAPSEDYLADLGRTRILGAPLPDDPSAIVGICVSLFTDAYDTDAEAEIQFLPCS